MSAVTKAVAKSSPETDQSGEGTRRREDSASFLTVYFREMSSLDVLKPEEELRIAQEIEALEMAIWVRLLGFWPMTNLLLARCGDLEDPPSFRALRRAANRCAKDPSKKNAQAVAQKVRLVSEALRDSDKDRIVQKSLIDFVMEEQPKELSCTKKEYQRYRRQVMGADRAAHTARNEFVKANLRLVVSIARRFNYGRMALPDLIQEGNLGLIKAVERFDHRRGFRFSTYASWWIRHAISRALADKGREVRLPVHMIDAQHRIAKAKRELTAKLSRTPTSEELAAATDIAVSKIEKMRTYLVDSALSFDKPMNDEDGRTLADVLEDENSGGDQLIQKLGDAKETSRLRALLADLKPIEAEILRQRFGLDDDQEHTLKEIGSRYNLSRERIRQLQEQALLKMRRAFLRAPLRPEPV